MTIPGRSKLDMKIHVHCTAFWSLLAYWAHMRLDIRCLGQGFTSRFYVTPKQRQPSSYYLTIGNTTGPGWTYDPNIHSGMTTKCIWPQCAVLCLLNQLSKHALEIFFTDVQGQENACFPIKLIVFIITRPISFVRNISYHDVFIMLIYTVNIMCFF